MAEPARQNALHLSDGFAELDILSDQGASIGRYELIANGTRHPLFVPTPFGRVGQTPNLAAILLIPWSNRIGGGGFAYDGDFISLAPNLEGEPLPIHGNGFQLPWAVEQKQPDSATLSLASDGPGVFRYFGRVTYALVDGCLRIALSATNESDRPLPFGLGIHPWLPRTPRTRLAFSSREVWLEDGRHLPAAVRNVTGDARMDFSEPRSLPRDWINNAFGGWNGAAEITWPERGIGLRISASPELRHCLVFSPNGNAPFFCFEPVSHPVDAHNQPGLPGLRMLEPGETLEAWCRFEPVIQRQPDLHGGAR